MTRIAILHPGEMGAGVGAALVGAGHDVGWLPAGRRAQSRERAERAGFRPLDDLTDREVVLSICPPGAAVETAHGIGRFDGVYVDANAISPTTAARVSAAVTSHGATYVDGGIIGGPPDVDGLTGLYLSGTDADTVAALFDGTTVRTTVIRDRGDHAASATKMAYSSWSKISQALVLAADGTAAELGVQDVLHDAWRDSHHNALDLLDRARAAAATKGWRWEAEMREIARTYADAGEPAGFGDAAAEIYGRYPRAD